MNCRLSIALTAFLLIGLAGRALEVKESDVVLIPRNWQLPFSGISESQMRKGSKAIFEAAEAGEAKSQIIAGWVHARGLIRGADLQEAIKWFTKAAEQGEAAAQHYLGCLHLRGIGVPENATNARKWFDQALAQDWPPTKAVVALMYMEGDGRDENVRKGLTMMDEAAKAGHVAATGIMVGKYRFSGNDWPQRLDIAHQYAHYGAKYGNQRCLNTLIENSLWGYVVAGDSPRMELPDYLKTFEWLCRQYPNDSHRVIEQISGRVKPMSTRSQKHVERWIASLTLSRRAILQNEAEAQLEIARRYLGEIEPDVVTGIPINIPRAAQWAMIARSNGVAQADRIIEQILPQLTTNELATIKEDVHFMLHPQRMGALARLINRELQRSARDSSFLGRRRDRLNADTKQWPTASVEASGPPPIHRFELTPVPGPENTHLIAIRVPATKRPRQNLLSAFTVPDSASLFYVIPAAGEIPGIHDDADIVVADDFRDDFAAGSPRAVVSVLPSAVVSHGMDHLVVIELTNSHAVRINAAFKYLPGEHTPGTLTVIHQLGLTRDFAPAAIETSTTAAAEPAELHADLFSRFAHSSGALRLTEMVKLAKSELDLLLRHQKPFVSTRSRINRRGSTPGLDVVMGLDRNRDRKVDREEFKNLFRPAVSRRNIAPIPLPYSVRHLDTNSDGKIDAAEYRKFRELSR